MWIFIDLISVVVCVFPFSSSSFSTSSTSSSSSFSSSTSYQIQGTNNVSFKLFNIHDLFLTLKFSTKTFKEVDLISTKICIKFAYFTIFQCFFFFSSSSCFSLLYSNMIFAVLEVAPPMRKHISRCLNSELIYL